MGFYFSVMNFVGYDYRKQRAMGDGMDGIDEAEDEENDSGMDKDEEDESA